MFSDIVDETSSADCLFTDLFDNKPYEFSQENLIDMEFI